MEENVPNYMKTICDGVARNNYSMGFGYALMEIYFLLNELKEKAKELGLDPDTIAEIKKQICERVKDNVDEVVTQFK
ncbi:MAG: hypothetical protein PHW01_02120 [Patescibacteria group bacterium]|nr:hypothetical protein [Patescibacteria group bacterium]